MVGCCVPRCGKNSSKPESDQRCPGRRITYHQFPSHETTRYMWINAVRNGGRPDEWEPTNNTKICSLHFNLDDIEMQTRGTAIRKGAVPVIPYSEKKKARRNRAETRKKFETLVQETVEIEGDITDWIAAEFDTNSPSTSSSPDYYVEIPMEEAIPPPPSKKVVMNAPTEEFPEQNSQSKKVVKFASDHTFEAPRGATFEDPCLSKYSEMMDLMKKFNQLMTIHHPDKAHLVGHLMNQAANIFSPEEAHSSSTSQQPKLANDPFMGIETYSLDSMMVNDSWTQEVKEFVTSSALELEIGDLLEYPEKYLP